LKFFERSFFCHEEHEEVTKGLPRLAESGRGGWNMAELIFREECYAIVGAAMAVHDELGSGFTENVYQEALEIEFRKRGIPYERQKKLPIWYDGQEMTCFYVADLVVYGSIIVELKATRVVGSSEQAQLIGYLKATHLRPGLLINFGNPLKLDWQRLVF
jgi:GxxExxY protein